MVRSSAGIQAISGARIFLNALALRRGGGGVSTYCRELIHALDRVGEARLIARIQSDALDEVPEGIEVDDRPVSEGLRRLVAGLRPAGEAELVHGLDIDLPFRPGCPTVTTVHDLSVFDVPWTFSRHRAAGERLAVRHAIKAADAVIAVSKFTAAAISERFEREATITHLAPRPGMAPPDEGERERIERSYELPARFVLHVGSAEPRKHLPELADACRQVGVPLLLAGISEADWVRSSGARALGYVPAGDLAGLYGTADAVAYASVYEGFALPPIEAAACGAPVVATAVGALPELFGRAMDLAVPGDSRQLAEMLKAAVFDEDHRTSLRVEGRKAVAGLSWDTTARATAGVYRSLGVEV
jgi:glycosyltransferase involved in cell wall biosynthesis